MINAETHAARLERTLKYSVIDAATFSFMVGAGETFIVAFALALGLDEVSSGLLSVLPMVVGAFLQLISPRSVRKLGSAKKWVVICAIIQALAFLPLIFLAILEKGSFVVLFLATMMYWAGGAGTGAAWNAWMGKVVPRSIRTRYFAFRGRVAHLGVLVGLIFAAYIAEYGRKLDQTLHAFALIFGLALIARLISSYSLWLKYEPPDILANQKIRPFSAVLHELLLKKEGKVLQYLLFVQLAVNISGPYFAPYMLKELALDYEEYMVLVAVSFLARALVLPLVGQFAKHFSVIRLLKIGGLLIVPSPMLWAISDHFYFLILAQVFAGISWALFELGMALSFFEGIKEDEKTSILTVFNLVNALAMAFGGMIGGHLLTTLGVEKTNYYVLFVVSGLLRGVALYSLVGLKGMKMTVRPIVMRVLALRPDQGIERPVMATLEDDAKSKNKPKT